MPITASKKFTFESAHRLIQGYPNKCKNIHGHSYNACVTLGLKPGAELDQYGFIKDFGDFKPLKEWIDNNLDHATLISIEDTELAVTLDELHSKYFVIEHPNTSAEYLVKVLYDKACELMEDERIAVTCVTINETCTSETKYIP